MWNYSNLNRVKQCQLVIKSNVISIHIYDVRKWIAVMWSWFPSGRIPLLNCGNDLKLFASGWEIFSLFVCFRGFSAFDIGTGLVRLFKFWTINFVDFGNCVDRTQPHVELTHLMRINEKMFSSKEQTVLKKGYLVTSIPKGRCRQNIVRQGVHSRFKSPSASFAPVDSFVLSDKV